MQYKNHLEEEGIDDDTYDESKDALFRIQGMGLNNMQAIQVDLVSLELKFSSIYLWLLRASLFFV